MGSGLVVSEGMRNRLVQRLRHKLVVSGGMRNRLVQRLGAKKGSEKGKLASCKTLAKVDSVGSPG